ncbi:MAG: crossover junction endodeoxyribonuclease RuvC [Anaerolineales bacterium]
MIVLGLDPGIALTGYGIVREEDNGEIVSLDYGVISTPSYSNETERLLTLHQRLSAIILLHQPDSSAVEKLFFQKNTRTAMTVGQARGVVLLTLAQQGVSVYEYAPVEIKQALTGYGLADKRQIQMMVKMRLGLEEVPKPDDAADALAIAICHIQFQHINSYTSGAS